MFGIVNEVSAILVATTISLEPGGGSLNTSNCFSLDKSEYRGSTCTGNSIALIEHPFFYKKNKIIC